jgi:hypothetical protein
MGGSPRRKRTGCDRGRKDRDHASGPERMANVNPTYEWVRLAQRMPPRIHIDDVHDNVRIGSGITCTVVVAAPARPWASRQILRDAGSAMRHIGLEAGSATRIEGGPRERGTSMLDLWRNGRGTIIVMRGRASTVNRAGCRQHCVT